MNFNFLDAGCVVYTLLYLFAFFTTMFVKNINARRVCFFIIVISEVLISGLRGLDVGSDTRGYAELLIPQLKTMSYSDILHRASWVVEKEPVCYCFFKLISDPFQTFTPYFLIVQVIFWLLISNTLLKFSKDPLLSLFIFIAFRFPFFNMSAMRQGLALAIGTFSYRYYVKEKKILFILFVLLAFLFHRSAIVLLLLLFINKINFAKKRWLVYVLALALMGISYVISSTTGFLNMFNGELMYGNYLNEEGGGNYFSIVFTILIFVFISMFLSKDRGSQDINKSSYNIAVLSLLLTCMGLFVNIFFRISMYYSFIVPILYANSLYGIRDNNRNIWFNVSVVTMLIVYIFTGVVEDYVPYEFYWE